METLTRFALSLGAIVLLVRCGPSQSQLSSPAVLPQTTEIETPVYRTLYHFATGEDGANPNAGFVAAKDLLYGTTSLGGTDNDGTIFSINTNGTVKVLYQFTGSPDGEGPYANVLDVNGTFYGTTALGGEYDSYSTFDQGGTVFKVTPDGKETVLHSFGGVSDGRDPLASLIDVNGTLYGTTELGGADGSGTVFTITTSGKERVLYSFQKGESDGTAPSANVIDVDGTLYGTTDGGGAYGEGTVFSISIKGKERVLHSFGYGSDGNSPVAGLIDVNGTLYGTTFYGGTKEAGTVFSISTSGEEKVIYNFRRGHDASGPYANLIDVNGLLYSTTASGGSRGIGTIFSITTTGKEHVLHSFGVSDGYQPAAGLIDVKGTLYGTTSSGGGGAGCHTYGCGTVFSIKP